MSTPPLEPLTTLVNALDGFRGSLRNVRAKHVGTTAMRDTAKGVVQSYFREARALFTSTGCDEAKVAQLDAAMQRLLLLSNGRNRKASYTEVTRIIRSLLQDLEAERELHLGEQQTVIIGGPVYSTYAEGRILTILQQLLPSAALSYEQALRDLADANRLSFRGTANELREALREVLDHLAPDEAVTNAKGFKFEQGKTTPTQKQKVRYILRGRGTSKNAAESAEHAADLVEALTASVTRSTYVRASVAAHVVTTKQEVLQMKMYVDTVLSEFLEVHR